MERLQPFIGTWGVQANFGDRHPTQGEFDGRTTFEWTLDGAFVLQRSEVDHPDAPSSLCLIGPKDNGGYIQHYFDSRTVARLYDMTFDGRVWTLTRERADFTPLEFTQRYVGTFDDDGRAIRGAWEILFEGQDWKKDFGLDYVRTD
jgi:hypothetical protein